MAEIPRNAVTRTAKLAGLPLGIAGRATWGLGKRIGGRPAEVVAAEVQARTAEQLFRVLGELKGGAMKAGQALSVLEAALPEDMAGPYRAALTKLQEAAPPMPDAVMERQLAHAFGNAWQDRFQSFERVPAAAASIGQVHRGVWEDGRPVAVKVQYPGAGKALISDLNQLSRFGRMFGVLSPGLDVKALLTELRDRVVEELDYALEADAQRRFAAAYRDDPDIYVPDVIEANGQAIVSEWVEGVPLAQVIADGSQLLRDRAGLLFVRFLYSGPERVGMLHADPHPGNFRILEDGRLGVLDFGAVNHLPGGLPEVIGQLISCALADDADAVLNGLRAEGFVRGTLEVDQHLLLRYLRPLLDPIAEDEFTFSRSWLRRQAVRLADPRSPVAALGRQLNLPPDYVLIHRVTLGAVGVLSQLGSTGPFRKEMQRWQPGFGPVAAELAEAPELPGA
ncbi:MAG TPA: AarF/ABC1/UbiB kinase family protein [Frankiaceae bacterium]